MALTGYPPQEPLSQVAQAYHERVTALGSGVPAGEVFAYGPDPYQQVLFYPAATPTCPVLAFIHGGGWTNGYKEWLAFMAPAVTGAEFAFASIGYRLAPTHVFPTGFEDCADALVSIRARAPLAPLFVGGHSAGGHYAALLAVRMAWWLHRGLAANPLRGCLPVSGVYLFGERSGLTVRPRFLGPGHTERAASPILDIDDPTPFLIACGERDFPHLITQADAMIRALRLDGNEAEGIVLAGCDHFQASYHTGEANGVWLAKAREFIARHSG